MVSAPASQPFFDSSLRSRTIRSSSPAATARELPCGRLECGAKAASPSASNRLTSWWTQNRETR